MSLTINNITNSNFSFTGSLTNWLPEPFHLNQTYPLYYTQEAANNASPFNSSHTHTINGIDYFMPNSDGSFTLYHNNYNGGINTYKLRSTITNDVTQEVVIKELIFEYPTLYISNMDVSYSFSPGIQGWSTDGYTVTSTINGIDINKPNQLYTLKYSNLNDGTDFVLKSDFVPNNDLPFTFEFRRFDYEQGNTYQISYIFINNSNTNDIFTYIEFFTIN